MERPQGKGGSTGRCTLAQRYRTTAVSRDRCLALHRIILVRARHPAGLLQDLLGGEDGRLRAHRNGAAVRWAAVEFVSTDEYPIGVVAYAARILPVDLAAVAARVGATARTPAAPPSPPSAFVRTRRIGLQEP